MAQPAALRLATPVTRDRFQREVILTVRMAFPGTQ